MTDACPLVSETDTNIPVPGNEATTQVPRTSDFNTDVQPIDALDESFCNRELITKKRSREMTEPTVQVKLVTQSVHLIVDKLVSRKRKRN